MRKLIISLVIILMFDFSLNKINPVSAKVTESNPVSVKVTKSNPVSVEVTKSNPISVKVTKPIRPIKKNEIIKPCFQCVKCRRDYSLYCSSRCKCKCIKRSEWPFIKPSNSTTTKIIKQK